MYFTESSCIFVITVPRLSMKVYSSDCATSTLMWKKPEVTGTGPLVNTTRLWRSAIHCGRNWKLSV